VRVDLRGGYIPVAQRTRRIMHLRLTH
jgi:hypothetical protein